VDTVTANKMRYTIFVDIGRSTRPTNKKINLNDVRLE
jgi:hypothetical protein